MVSEPWLAACCTAGELASTTCRYHSLPRRVPNRQTTTTAIATARMRSENSGLLSPESPLVALRPAMGLTYPYARPAPASRAGGQRTPPRRDLRRGGPRYRLCSRRHHRPERPAHERHRRQGKYGRVDGLYEGHLDQPALARRDQLGLADYVTGHDEYDHSHGRTGRRDGRRESQTGREHLRAAPPDDEPYQAGCEGAQPNGGVVQVEVGNQPSGEADRGSLLRPASEAGAHCEQHHEVRCDAVDAQVTAEGDLSEDAH